MITFLNFIQENYSKKNWKHPDNSIEISSFSEVRKNDWRHPDRSIEIPSFADQRKRSLNENWIEDYDKKALQELNKLLKTQHNFSLGLNHEHVKPSELKEEQENSLRTFAEGSTALNKYLSKTHRKESTKEFKKWGVDSIHQHIKTISSSFTPENTNKIPLTVYSGIQQKYAHKLLKFSKGQEFNVPSFVSTSFSPLVAFDFAQDYNREGDENDVYILKILVEPGAGLSISHISPHKKEQEVILHHGIKMRYEGTLNELENNSKPFEFKKFETSTITYKLIVFLATAFNEHIPFEDYGKFDSSY